jgi:hypothetical protein
LGSVTVPAIEPVLDCAKAAVTARALDSNIKVAFRIIISYAL